MTERAAKKPVKAGMRKNSAPPRRSRLAAVPGAKIVSAPRRESTAPQTDARFGEVIDLIEAARSRAYQAVNTELVTLYWQLGEHISRKIEQAEWGDGVVDELAAALAAATPGCAASRARTCSGCGSSTSRTGPTRESHRW